jgi:FkbM family methyltransferase
MELGWSGMCVEPNAEIYKRLVHNCNDFPNVKFCPYAIGETNGFAEFNLNDTYYSTLKESELKRWENSNFKFSSISVEVYDFKTFYKEFSDFKTYDFISIDCEGVDYEILTQINLDEVDCYMVCVETNGKETEKYIDYINQFKGFSVLTINPENLIMARTIIEKNKTKTDKI